MTQSTEDVKDEIEKFCYIKIKTFFVWPKKKVNDEL